MTRISLTATTMLTIGALTLAACNREPESPIEPTEAEADAVVPAVPTSFALAGGDGAAMGKVTLSEESDGLTIKIDATGLPAGVHGVHLHEAGRCDGPGFDSAGAHWNPGRKQHGRDNPQGAHLGDLANLDVAAGGGGSASFVIGGAGTAGADGLGDADGTSLVIHARPDDYKTNPSGNSGDRIACAVIAAPSGG